MITKELFGYLKKLEKNNNRDWFTEHKPTFKGHEQEMKDFFSTINTELCKHDEIERHKIMRIYRDVRFSKDKTPYKARFSGSFTRATVANRGSYYLNIEPGNCMVGGGFYGPNADDLKRIRQEFEMDDTEMRAILNEPKFKHYFGALQGAELKTAPRGFSTESKAVDLIRKKQFYVFRSFTNQEAMQENFTEEIVKTYQVIRPYFDYMSAILTTNLNGESIL